eukprot:366209-Chlamydomonas_euryale.AAC.2
MDDCGAAYPVVAARFRSDLMRRARIKIKVCDGKWEEHETVFETTRERIAAGRPVALQVYNYRGFPDTPLLSSMHSY